MSYKKREIWGAEQFIDAFIASIEERHSSVFSPVPGAIEVREFYCMSNMLVFDVPWTVAKMFRELLWNMIGFEGWVLPDSDAAKLLVRTMKYIKSTYYTKKRSKGK